MTASRKVLEGMVPVLTQTPPSMPGLSTTATFLPLLLDEMAQFRAAGPVPMIKRSKSYLTGLVVVGEAFVFVAVSWLDGGDLNVESVVVSDLVSSGGREEEVDLL